MRTHLIAHLLVLTAASSSAQETIKLESGQAVTGHATAYDAEEKILFFRTSDGNDMQYTMDQLDQRSVYLVYSSVIPEDDAKAQLQLANFARDSGLYMHAARRYGFAEKADPTLKPQIDRELTVLRRSAADYCLANAKAAQQQGDTKAVIKWCSLLVEKLPEEPQAAEARAMIELHYAAERNARDDQLEKEHEELLQKDLKRGKEHYDRMIARTKEGLTARSSTKQTLLWEGAIEDGHVVLKEIDRIAKKYSDDPKVQDGAAQYRELTVKQLIDTNLHLASFYTSRSNLTNAMKVTNAALALDPSNPSALAQRARIEQAANEGSAWRGL
jgi:hypothetical protein